MRVKVGREAEKICGGVSGRFMEGESGGLEKGRGKGKKAEEGKRD